MKKLMTVILSIITILSIAATGKCDDSTNYFELRLEGTTGYGVIDLVFRADDSSKSAKLGVIPAGEPFAIISEGQNYFEISYHGQTGYAYKAYTMVNLPDLIPSIIYDATNSYDSQFKSCEIALNNVTHQGLYTGKTWNAKLGYEEYNMPVLYTMAKKIARVQHDMKLDNRSLVLYEGYRPMSVQQLVNLELGNLVKSVPEVNKAINYSGWGKSWFIAKGVSNHQRGYAIDCGMASVSEFETLVIANQEIAMPRMYGLEVMPTDIHELSPAAASLAQGVSSSSKTAWTKIANADTMTDSALALRNYCVNAGMTPLASEWWHFNDLDAKNETGAKGNGQFEITGNVSK